MRVEIAFFTPLLWNDQIEFCALKGAVENQANLSRLNRKWMASAAPKDLIVVQQLLRELGITKYDESVPSQLVEYIHRLCG